MMAQESDQVPHAGLRFPNFESFDKHIKIRIAQV
jgi:hypothetical protein